MNCLRLKLFRLVYEFFIRFPPHPFGPVNSFRIRALNIGSRCTPMAVQPSAIIAALCYTVCCIRACSAKVALTLVYPVLFSCLSYLPTTHNPPTLCSHYLQHGTSRDCLILLGFSPYTSTLFNTNCWFTINSLFCFFFMCASMEARYIYFWVV